jgi:circadian clock protein KaiC
VSRSSSGGVIAPNVRLDTGVAGLNDVLMGGLVPNRAYLVRGGPGSGKTTLGLHFLAAGASAERRLYITLGESASQIRDGAMRLGIDTAGVEFLDLSPTSDFFAQLQTYDIFTPAEVEREPTTKRIVATVSETKPGRIFIDSITQFRYLASDAFQFRRQIISFMRYLIEAGATVLFASEGTEEVPDDDLQFLADGVITLGSTDLGRTLRIDKLRGSGSRAGVHSMRLADHGMEVFPRLVPEARAAIANFECVPSGVPELDALLHGGLQRSTVTIVSGPSGSGKTSLGLQFMKEAAGRGERSVVYSFEEEVPVMLARCDGIQIPARAMIEHGTLVMRKIEPLVFGPEQFAAEVRCEVEERGAKIVMLDSVAGYRLSVRGEGLTEHLHALCKYLQNRGVLTLLVNEVESITGDFRVTDAGLSYLADNVIFLRFIEIGEPGQAVELRKAIGVLKKRLGDFEKGVREYEITSYGLRVGKPLVGLRGLLTGVPEIVGSREGAR